MDPNRANQQPQQVLYQQQPQFQTQPQPVIVEVQPVYYNQPQPLYVANQPVFAQNQTQFPQYQTQQPGQYIPNGTEEPLLQKYDPASVKERLCSRTYEVTIQKWIKDAWALYADHWIAYTLYAILIFLVSFIPYVGSVISFALAPGYFFAGAHTLRSGSFRGITLWHGFLYFFPFLLIQILYSLALAVGFFLLIIPGFYFLVALSFSAFVYFEYHSSGLGIIDSMTVSRRVITKHFCAMFWFMIVVMLLNILGFICLMVGIFVSVPVTSLMSVVAFRDIFGLSSKPMDTGCVCC